MFGNNYGLEFTVTVMENRYDRFTVFSLDFLGVAAVTGITAVMTGNRILLITQIESPAPSSGGSWKWLLLLPVGGAAAGLAFLGKFLLKQYKAKKEWKEYTK